MRVVIGAGTDGLRAAAALAATGEQVCLVQSTDTPHGLQFPDLPEGTGRLHISSDARAFVETVIGPVVEAPDLVRAIAVREQVHRLPLDLMAVPQLFDTASLQGVGLHFVRRRARNGLIPLTGGGQEERSYRQWVERRMGGPAYHHMYSDYASRRWGADGDNLSSSVARVHHNPSEYSTAGQVSGGGPRAALDHAVSVIESHGGTIMCGANVKGLKVVDGTVVAVRVGRKNIVVDGPVWIARPPSVVASWLGDVLHSGLHVDARLLQTMDAVQVSMPIAEASSFDEIHLLGSDSPAWRLTQSYGGEFEAVYHCTVPSGTPAPDPSVLAAVGSSLGLKGLEPAAAKVERLSEWNPLWAPLTHTRLRRLFLAFGELGVVSVGRRGTFSPICAGREIELAGRYAHSERPDQREALRSMLEPPVRSDDLNASFRDFIWV
jgi:hypothetical protein